MQIAVVVPDEVVGEIDKLVPSPYRSRAEVVRVALDDLLRDHRRRLIDDQYLAALEATDGNVAVGALRAGDAEPVAWADIPW
ncbi:MAG: ribbon-helix-helix domain-containing protein [Actinomycetia bacterium]|nr:ribbon-helix-helix domain-containing protein [Actinomycetes bacterium]